MNSRIIEDVVIFNNPFKVPGLKKLIPAGSYRIEIMQELLEGLSFLAYRKVAVILYIPTKNNNSISKERSIIFEPKDFQVLLETDKQNKTTLFFQIKEALSQNISSNTIRLKELRQDIERGENEGMFIPT